MDISISPLYDTLLPFTLINATIVTDLDSHKQQQQPQVLESQFIEYDRKYQVPIPDGEEEKMQTAYPSLWLIMLHVNVYSSCGWTEYSVMEVTGTIYL